jgi:hypothetical protein
MWIVTDPANGIYAEGDTVPDALNAAVVKFSPDHRQKIRHELWEHMKRLGFDLEPVVPFPFPHKGSSVNGPDQQR